MPYRRPMSWDEGFAHHYEEWSADMTADVPFYVELARDADGPLVELAVGSGRVAIPVAQATGRRVIGIDTSPAMLAARACARVGGGGRCSSYARETCATSLSTSPRR